MRTTLLTALFACRLILIARPAGAAYVPTACVITDNTINSDTSCYKASSSSVASGVLVFTSCQ